MANQRPRSSLLGFWSSDVRAPEIIFLSLFLGAFPICGLCERDLLPANTHEMSDRETTYKRSRHCERARVAKTAKAARLPLTNSILGLLVASSLKCSIFTHYGLGGCSVNRGHRWFL